jgi:gas vesicle protein
MTYNHKTLYYKQLQPLELCTKSLAAYWNHQRKQLLILKTTIMSTGKVITGILAGAAAGAILGVLFAPDKGSETRAKIAQKSSELTDAIKEGYGKVAEAVTNNYEAMKENAKEYGKQKVATVKEEFDREYAS